MKAPGGDTFLVSKFCCIHIFNFRDGPTREKKMYRTQLLNVSNGNQNDFYVHTIFPFPVGLFLSGFMMRMTWSKSRIYLNLWRG